MSIKETKIVTCVTCCIAKALDNPQETFEAICWNNSYNLHLVEEEEEAFLHSQTHPYHIMIEGMDFGYKVNGF